MNAIFNAFSLMLRRCYSPVVKGIALALCFLISAGCRAEYEHTEIEIIHNGYQGINIRTQGPGSPIYIISRYCGYDKDDLLVLNNGRVVIFVVDDKVTMIAWETEDLTEGCMMQVNSSELDGFSVRHDRRWWLQVAKMDNRFSVQSY